MDRIEDSATAPDLSKPVLARNLATVPDGGITSPSEVGRLRILVDLSSGLDLDKPLDPALERFSGSEIRLSRQHWEMIREKFTLPEAVVLAQALTVLERDYQWTGGCGASAIWIVKDLLDREPATGGWLAAWITPRTRNGYLRLACDSRPAVRMWVGDLHQQNCGR